jgi:serine protease Do
MGMNRKTPTWVPATLLGFVAGGAGGYLLYPDWGSASAPRESTPQTQVAPHAAAVDFTGLVKKMNPSVVNISTLASSARGPSRRHLTPDEFFRRFFGESPWGMEGAEGETSKITPKHWTMREPRPRPLALGTGFVIDEQGLIVTNYHVIDQADEILVSFTESETEKPLKAEVVGKDPELDIALLRVSSPQRFQPVALGDSDALEVGERVLAIGNPFGQGHTVTQGIISAKGRFSPNLPLGSYLQTDAPINPGNSGGPLVNMRGEVIGINNAIDARAQGIGFAIPVNLVKRVLPQLREKGVVSRGFVGVSVEPLTEELAAKLDAPKDLRAPVVTQIQPGEPAHRAGVQVYDILLEFNGKPIRSSSELVSEVSATEVGSKVPLKVLRDGRELKLSIEVADRSKKLISMR